MYYSHSRSIEQTAQDHTWQQGELGGGPLHWVAMCPVNIWATVKRPRLLKVLSVRSKAICSNKQPLCLSSLKAQRFVSHLCCLTSEGQQGPRLITATQGSRLKDNHHLPCFRS